MSDDWIPYERSRFKTSLPANRLFTSAHYWLAEEGGGVLVGFTKFATRMLGDVVEFEFEAREGTDVEIGDAIGWFEGFKAVTEVYAPLTGLFAGANPALAAAPDLVHRFPYGEGWLFRIDGEVPEDVMDAEAYACFLDETIDRMMGRR